MNKMNGWIEWMNNQTNFQANKLNNHQVWAVQKWRHAFKGGGGVTVSKIALYLNGTICAKTREGGGGRKVLNFAWRHLWTGQGVFIVKTDFQPKRVDEISRRISGKKCTIQVQRTNIRYQLKSKQRYEKVRKATRDMMRQVKHGTLSTVVGWGTKGSE